MAADVLTFLMENQDDYVSGEYIAKKIGISRMAVSKKIALLKEGGFDIVSKTNKGYRLVSVPDVIIPEYISQKTLFRTIYHYETVDSTNLYARTFALAGAPERTLVVSEMQDAGRGRLGRVWSSPKGGLWFSFVLRPRCPPSDAPILNFVASNAIAKALKSLYGITVSMKWPNDIFYRGNKLCGVAFWCRLISTLSTTSWWALASMSTMIHQRHARRIDPAYRGAPGGPQRALGHHPHLL
jgi:BirA family biotin operon repressor/biotin-[acetyl-CoA-carboxylase] ligase